MEGGGVELGRARRRFPATPARTDVEFLRTCVILNREEKGEVDSAVHRRDESLTSE
jgi:hypothetical protein